MSDCRIGVVTTSYPRHPADAAGRFVAELCGWLAERGHEVQVLAPHPAASEHPGVEVHGLRYALRPRLLYGAGAPDNLARSPAAWAQAPLFTARLALACGLHHRSWDRMISHWLLPCSLVVGQVARGLPHLAVAHSSDVHLLGRLPGGAVLLRALARPRTGLVLTSEALRAVLLPLSRDRRAGTLVETAPVIRMGIDHCRLAPADPRQAARLRLAYGLGPASRLVLFVGRLVPVKGVDWLVRALAWLGRRDVTLVALGQGPEHARLEALAARLRVPARFPGLVGPVQRDAWLSAADLLAMPSVELSDGRSDAAPVALLEAMGQGLPVVASRSGGAAELIRDGDNGLLVPPGEVGPLAAALRRLLDNEALRQRLGQAARRTAAEHTWDQVGARLRGLLMDL